MSVHPREYGLDDSLVSTFAPADHAAVTGLFCLKHSQLATGRNTVSLLPSSHPPDPGMSKARVSEGWTAINDTVPPFSSDTLRSLLELRAGKTDQGC